MLGPSLIFDKSSLESLNLDEAVLMDNFYISTITPLFFIECLADLEKNIRSSSRPEQLVGSLADRTPEAQSYPNVHHRNILLGELSRRFDITNVHGRVALAEGQNVELGDKKGVVFRTTQEEEALQRWTRREFLEVERCVAKEWRRALTAVDFNAMVNHVRTNLGRWRTPRTLGDARQIADIVIDNIDPEYLIRFGLNLLGSPEPTEWVINDWAQARRPPLRKYLPYFVFMLTINIFFCLVLPTQLLKNVKASHQVDLAYLYYLPFCSVFTSKDNFHAQVVPLFLSPNQTFVNGTEFKEEMRRLNEYYSALPDEVLKTGLVNFASYPPDDTGFLTTRLWDQYLPVWRELKSRPSPVHDPESERQLIKTISELTDSPDLRPHNENDMDKLDYATFMRSVRPRKGKWRRFPEEQERCILEHKEVS